MMYNVEKYRAAIAALKGNVQDIEEAIDGLSFEHGEGGISSRAPTYLRMLNESLADINKSIEVVNAMILAHGYHHESAIADLQRRAGIIVE